MQAQVNESTYSWGTFDHSAWKVEPNSPQGYVIMGGKFFEPANTNLYITGFDEFAQHQWTRTHASGFTQLDVFWKSFVRLPNGPVRYFAVSSGTFNGSHQAYALLLNATGMKFWDRTSPLPLGITFGGVTNASNGGWVAVGGTNSGTMAIVKFDAYGVLEWYKDLGVSGFGWTIAPAVGGGYVMAGTRAIVRTDFQGNVEWSSTLNLPISPDGSAYTYTEFEEITQLPDGQGFLLTGSAFSNSTSATYIARVGWNGGVAWSKINDPVNTALAGTPVSWTNNAVVSGSNEIVTSWRNGPVSAGGQLRFQKYNFSGTTIGGVTSFGNNTPVQEAFMTKAHGKYIIGGTRGTYSAAYGFAREFLPFTSDPDDRTDNLCGGAPCSDPNFFTDHRAQLGPTNSNPNFQYPTTSRVFASELRVYPNPSSGLINVGGAVEPGTLLRVVSPTGAVVMERQVQEGEAQVELDLSSASTGVYTVQVVGSKSISAKRVVIE